MSIRRGMLAKRNCIPSHSYHQGGNGDYWDVRRPYSNRFQNKMAQPPNVFKREKRPNDTELSKHLWKLKEKKEGYSISWKIIAKAKSYSNTTKRCNLCITEKFFILSNPQMATLNKRNELISNCRHRRKYILKYSWNFVDCIISTRRFFINWYFLNNASVMATAKICLAIMSLC